MKVRLTRKLADRVDDVSLTGRIVGDVFELSDGEARVLIAEGWAEMVAPPRRRAGDYPAPRRRSRKPPR